MNNLLKAYTLRACSYGFQMFKRALTNSKDWSESRYQICVTAFLRSHWSIFFRVQSTFKASFRNNFQDHRQLSEQLLETQTAIGKPEQPPWRGFLLQSVNDFVNKHFRFSSQKDSKRLWKPSALNQKGLLWFFEPSKKIFHSWHYFFEKKNMKKGFTMQRAMHPLIFWLCVCISCGKEDGGMQRVLNYL